MVNLQNSAFGRLACFLLSSYPGAALGCERLPLPLLLAADLHLLLQVNSSTERHWLYVSSDACRLAVIWKYGGVYMDTDVISIRPIPDENFLAAQSSKIDPNQNVNTFVFLELYKLILKFMWRNKLVQTGKSPKRTMEVCWPY